MAADSKSKDEILDYLSKSQISKNFPNEFKYYILLCGLFPAERHILLNWKKYEAYFLSIVSADGEIGIKHLMQSIILYFLKAHTELEAVVPKFMMHMYD